MDNSDYAKSLISEALKTSEVKDALSRFNCGEHTSEDWAYFVEAFEEKIRQLYVSNNPNQEEAKVVVIFSFNMNMFSGNLIVGEEYILKYSKIRIYIGGVEIELPERDSNVTTFSVKNMDSSKISEAVKSMK